MKKKYAFLAVMAALSLVVAATVYAGVIEEFAALERAYVPALALTNQPTTTPWRNLPKRSQNRARIPKSSRSP